MAEEYTPTTWANGNIVTAAGLNNIEQGIVNAGGSSDFSTAEVIVIDEGEEIDVPVQCSIIDAEDDTMRIDELHPGSNTVVLYKSSITSMVSEIYGDYKIISMVGSGNISVTEQTGPFGKEYTIEITGDGTLTVNADWA